MKFNYTNILLFSLSLNILLLSSQVYKQRNHNLTLNKPITTSRLLCECELYVPANYDNDPEMKEVMQDFDRQTSERFKEYDERMIKNKQKCKEQCEKDIQKIILKAKIEKELTGKLSTLQTDISTNDIPTCVCEQSLADKTEKLCLKCGYGLGSNIPLVGLINGIGFYSGVLEYAVDCGISEGARVAASETVKMITTLLDQNFNGVKDLLKGSLDVIVTTNTNSPLKLGKAVYTAVNKTCEDTLYAFAGEHPPSICISQNIKEQNITLKVMEIAGNASKAGEEAGAQAAQIAENNAFNSAFTWESFLSSPLGISIIVTVFIVVMLIIIYLILRYRRNKKMKKKLQYIKLFKE